MLSGEFKDRLLATYHGEQLGEAVFETLLAKVENAEQRNVIGTLLQLETEGKALMRPVLARLELPIDASADARAGGLSGAESLVAMPWQDKFSAMAASIRARGLPQYEQLATLVSADQDAGAHALALFMGKHERAILAAAERLAAGRANPLAPVNEILHFPLVASENGA